MRRIPRSEDRTMNPAIRRPSAGRASHLPRRDIAPDWIEVISLLVATSLEFILYWNGSYDLLNWLGPSLLGVIGAWGLWSLIRRAPAAIWSPLFTLRASTIVFLAIGSLATEIGEGIARDLVFSLYAYSPEEGAKTNAVFMAGYFLTIASVKACSLLWPERIEAVRRPVFSGIASLRLGLIFLGLGLSYTFLIQIPILLGRTGLVLPGTLMLMFGALNAVGTFLVALWAIERRGSAYLVVALLLLIQLLISLIMLEKTSFMMGALLVGLAFLLNKGSIVRILVLSAALGVILAFISPAITQGRLVHTSIYGDQLGGSATERLSYHWDYLRGYRIPATRLDAGSSFIRLNYTSPSAFVITHYDVGMGSDTIANSLYAIIPRAIWPDKPLVSAIGTDLNEMITGHSTSALGVGVFADAYWNFGWAGLLVFIPVGIFLWWASVRARAIVEARDWLMMPFVLVVFRIGLSVDNFFVLSWLTPAVMSLILFGILQLGRGIAFGGIRFGGGRRPAPARAPAGRARGAR